MKFLWAAYRVGAFDDIGIHNDMSGADFRNALDEYLSERSLTPLGFWIDGKMIGIGLFWVRGRCLETADLLWFPWATPRKILESYVCFINKIRKETEESTNRKYFVLEYAKEKDKKFFDTICKYGIMRRVGTSLEVYNDGKACIYESRGINAE